jgi:hypothetical protein
MLAKLHGGTPEETKAALMNSIDKTCKSISVTTSSASKFQYTHEGTLV